MNAPLLEIDHLITRLITDGGVVRAVDGLSLSINHGETFALLGESGCGKSMTALSIMRLLPEAGLILDGRIRLEGRDLLTISELEMRNIRGRHIGMVFQEPMLSLNPVMTIGNQVAEILIQHLKLPGEEAGKRALALLDAVGIPDAARRSGYYPFQFSGGMKQRVMIAMALACEPALLIADEPTTALDVTMQAQVLDLLRQIQMRSRMSILLITHDLGVVSEMAHQVAVMYAGEVVETADRERFFTHPAHPYSRKLFESLPMRNKRGESLAMIKGSVPPLTREFSGCRFVERCDFSWDRCLHQVPRWNQWEPGRFVRCHLYENQARGERQEAERIAHSAWRQGQGEDSRDKRYEARDANAAISLLEVKDVKVHFPIRKGLLKRTVGSVKAVDGVSFSILAGRTLALVGESGCGKTTLGKGILRLNPITKGSVRFNGQDLALLKPAELRPMRRDFQIIFQDPYASLNPRLRVAEIIEEGMAALGIGKGTEERMARIDHLLDEVGLSGSIKFRYPHEFSGGQRQRIAIARVLSVNPKLIICDEPTSALDISVQAQILNLLKELQNKHDLTYLFITHNISVVEYLAHEVAVMYLGRIVEQGRVEEILDHPRHPYTRALLSAVPVIEPETHREVIRLQGDLPSPADPPTGCHFHPRCSEVMPKCKVIYPAQSRFNDTHSVHCHLYGGMES
ncbi:MAG: ABC transporter ATP-binding protein [Deltaproteobacteria bacterium RBG_13_43_22]|nr:MAG: ABC transporter ATP-binding protein [Deltaproteobacteria bacterium RBG_13_43_22]